MNEVLGTIFVLVLMLGPIFLPIIGAIVAVCIGFRVLKVAYRFLRKLEKEV